MRKKILQMDDDARASRRDAEKLEKIRADLAGEEEKDCVSTLFGLTCGALIIVQTIFTLFYA